MNPTSFPTTSPSPSRSAPSAGTAVHVDHFHYNEGELKFKESLNSYSNSSKREGNNLRQSPGSKQQSKNFQGMQQQKNLPQHQPSQHQSPQHQQQKQPQQQQPHQNPGKCGTLYFSAFLPIDSLVGGCAWAVHDDGNVLITSGAVSVSLTYSSILRLEYEALLNGLKAAFTKKIRRLTIKGNSQMILEHLLHGFHTFPYFQTIYHSVKDLSAAIVKLLPHSIL